MSYGLKTYDQQGRAIVSLTDRLGRIVGYHRIQLKLGQHYQNTFNHPELAGLGQLFYWMRDWEFWSLEGRGSVTISGTALRVDLMVTKGGSGAPGLGPVDIFYGVR